MCEETMMTVTKGDIVREIDEWIKLATDNETDMAIKEFLSFLKERINALPSSDAEWIPCSERLPKAEYGEGDCVWATCCWKSHTTIRWDEKLYFNGGNWCYPTGECFTHKVIAWMPLPKPYRKGGEA